MRIARIQGGDLPTYHVEHSEHWAPVEELLPGVVLEVTADLFPHLAVLEQALVTVAPGAWPRTDDPSVVLTAPVARPSKIICIGLNYSEHIGETGAELPSVPVVFAKWPNTLTAPNADVELPAAATRALDYEGELAIVIGERCRDVDEADALLVIGAYTIANDLSARDRQMSEGGHMDALQELRQLPAHRTLADDGGRRARSPGS